MEHDFVYCPRCTRYSVFHWIRGSGQWVCEDCHYRPPVVEQDETLAWMSAETSPL